MTFADFILKYDGKGIDFDDAYGDQCVDLMNQYCVEVLGIPNPIQVLPGDTAFDIYQNYNGNQFDKIDNTPTGVPNNGNIVFFKPNILAETGSAGHVSLFIQGDINNFISFDQNYPTGSLCHKQAHNYTAVAGWLSFKEVLDVDNVAKAVEFDRIVTFLYSVGLLPTNNSTDYPNDKLLNAVESLKADRDHQAANATKWDQICSQTNQQGNSAQISVDQVFNALSGSLNIKDKQAIAQAITILNNIK